MTRQSIQESDEEWSSIHNSVLMGRAVRIAIKSYRARALKQYLAVGIIRDSAEEFHAEILTDEESIDAAKALNWIKMEDQSKGFHSHRDVSYAYADLAEEKIFDDLMVISMQDRRWSKGAWIWRARKALDISAAELAKSSNLSLNYIQRMESGLRQPSKHAMEEIELALGLTYEDSPLWVEEIISDLNLIIDNLDEGRVLAYYKIVGAIPVLTEVHALGEQEDRPRAKRELASGEGYFIMEDTQAMQLACAQHAFFTESCMKGTPKRP